MNCLALALLFLAQDTSLDVTRFRSRNAHTILREFAELLAIPNVASDDVNIRRNAEFIQAAFAQRAVELEVLQVDGAPPALYGKLEVPGATRTLGIYVHYDGQPVQAALWSDDPWRATLRTASIEAGGEVRPLPQAGEAVDPEWRLYARSAGDDKAPLIALLTAFDALREAELAPTSNFVFFFEGEEEAGSDHLGEYFERYGERLGADMWLICDGPVHQSRKPQLVFGVRGVTSIEIEVFGAKHGLHSGHYGNWAPNPGSMLAHLLASMKGLDGGVTIAGFYDTVLPLGEEERRALALLPDIDDELRAEFGIQASEGGGASLYERLALPSFNIRGLASAGVGAEARNVIPASATAAIDVRLVSGNEPEHMLDLIEAHVRSRGYFIVRTEPTMAERRAHAKIARVTRGRGYPAVRTPMDHPLIAPLAAAAERAAGESILLMPTLGGSLPLYLFTQELGVPIVVVPIANHDDNQHAPDENMRIANLWYGIDLMAEILRMP